MDNTNKANVTSVQLDYSPAILQTNVWRIEMLKNIFQQVFQVEQCYSGYLPL